MTIHWRILDVENGTVSPEFYVFYGRVLRLRFHRAPQSLVLNPVCSNANARIVSIDGTTAR